MELKIGIHLTKKKIKVILKNLFQKNKINTQLQTKLRTNVAKLIENYMIKYENEANI